MIIENQRIYLRELSHADAAFMQSLMNQNAWKQYIGDRNINSLEAAVDYLQKGPIRDYKLHGFGLYIVIDKASGNSVGVCGLLKRPYLSAPDLGFAISEEFLQKGYAYEASELCISFFIEKNFAQCLLASTKTDNLASRSLLKKLGFVEKGPLVIDPKQFPNYASDSLLLYQLDLHKPD